MPLQDRGHRGVGPGDAPLLRPEESPLHMQRVHQAAGALVKGLSRQFKMPVVVSQVR